MNSPVTRPNDNLLEALIAIVEDAADIIMDIYATDFSVQHKADHSPVTLADLASSEHIVAQLEALTPSTPVVSEENECPAFEQRKHWQQHWLVDPLDGTHGFVKRSGEFVINIALIERTQPVVGVVYLPVERSCYFARKGCGAFRRDANGDVERIFTAAHTSGPVRVATSRSRRNAKTRDFIQALGDVEVERLGSALKSCRVAEGRAHVYPGFSRTSEWDTAAAQCIVEQAGGRIIDTSGRPLRYNETPALENPSFLAVGDSRRDWCRWVPRDSD